MKILAVDDNIDRMMHIRSILPDYCKFEYVVSKKDAISKLSANNYDLVIVDVTIPENTSGYSISSDCGKSLIETIISANRISPPFQIVGVTVTEESYNENQDFFKERLIPFLMYNKDGEGDKAFLNLIARLKRVTEVFAQEIDVVIITAVEDEYTEVIKIPLGWKDYETKNSLITYKYGELILAGNIKISIVLVKLNEMGLVCAARQTECILNDLHPRLVCMCGICAGIKGKVNKGDLIVAEKSWDYGNGKILPQKDDGYYYAFDAEPNQIIIDRSVLSDLTNNGQKYLNIANNLWNEQNTGKNKYSPKLYIGALPSGAAVVQDEKLIKSVVIPQHRKVLGIDMETFAMYYACNYNKNTPKYISMKAVVDFADTKKDDEYHQYASFISIHTLIEFIKEYFSKII